MQSLNIKELKLLELQITQTRYPLIILQKKIVVKDPQKMRKKIMKCVKIYFSNVHKIGGAHLQYVNNHYTKFKYKGMKTFWDLQITQTRHRLHISV